MFLKVLAALVISSYAVSFSQSFFPNTTSSLSAKVGKNACNYVSSKNATRLNNDESWTIMMYMLDGSDLSVEDQLDEMIFAGTIPNDINIIIETNCDYYGDNDDLYLYRYCLADDGLYIDDVIPRSNMGLESTFGSFLEWGLDFYADKTGIIFYDHGLAIGGVCKDNYGLLPNQSDCLLASETSRIYNTTLENRGIDKLEFVGYDACVMQLQDVAEFNSHYFNYMIASEEEEYLSGWSYDYWLPKLYNHEDTITILEEIADTFVSYGIHTGDSWEQTLSILDLGEMPYYKTALETLASSISTTVSQNRSTFEGMIQSCWQYGAHAAGSSPETYELVDCYDLMSAMLEYECFDSYSNQILSVLNCLDNLVIYVVTTGISGSGSLSHGLTIHYSLDHYSNSYPLKETHFVNWWTLFHIEHTHNNLDGYNAQHHFLKCDCGHTINVTHDYEYAVCVTEQLHAKICVCGSYYIEYHNLNYIDGHGQTILYCSDCGYTIHL